MEKIKRLYNGIILAFAIPILVFLVFINAINTCYVESGSEHTMYLPDSVFINMFFFLLLLVLLWLLKRSCFIHAFSKKVNNEYKFYQKIRNSILAIILILSVSWVLSSQLVPVGDQMVVQNQAFLFEIGQYDIFSPGAYMERYWSQLGIMLFSWLLGKAAGFHNYLVFQLLNCIALTVIYLELSRLCELFQWNRMTALAVLTVGIVFLPLILYCSFVYGTWMGLMCALIGIRLEVEYFQKPQFRKAVLASVCIILSILLKSNYLIFFIGMILFGIVNTITRKKWYFGCLFVVLLLAGYVFQALAPKAFVKSVTGIELNQGEPVYDWIAEGLSEGERGPGWFSGLNFIMYKKANYQTEETAEMAKYEIERSIQAFKNDHHYAAAFFEKKIASMWSSPSFQSFFFFRDRDSLHEQSSLSSTILSAEFEIRFTAFLNILCFLIYGGTLLYVLSYPPTKSIVEELLLLMVFIGGFLFHIVWEVKALYALSFYVLLFPYAMEGYLLVGAKKDYDATPEKVTNKHHWRESFRKNGLNIAVFCIACLGVLLIGLRYGYHWLQTDKDMFDEYIQEETVTAPFSGEYILCSKNGGFIAVTDQNKLILSSDEPEAPFELREFNGGQLIRTGGNRYLTPEEHISDSKQEIVLMLRELERPFHKWKIRYVDSEYFMIRFNGLAVSVDEYTGKIILRNTDKKNDQLWKAISVEKLSAFSDSGALNK